MALPVLPVGSLVPITVTGGVTSDNQITFPVAQKYAWQVNATSPVGLTLWGPFPGGVVNPLTKTGLGKLAISGTKLNFGNTLASPGSYLLEITSPTTTTVELTISQWTVWDTLVMQWVWRLFG